MKADLHANPALGHKVKGTPAMKRGPHIDNGHTNVVNPASHAEKLRHS